MTQSISMVGSLNNGISSQLLANFNTSRSMAADLAGSIFNTSLPVTSMTPAYLNGAGMGMMYPGMGMGMGMYGMGMYGMYDPLTMNRMYQQIQVSNMDFQNEMMDRQSNWNVKHAWTNDINDYQVDIKDESFANKIQQMHDFITTNNADAANQMYQELLLMAAQKYGKETTGNNRLNAHNCMKAKINELYQQYTGSSIINDIDQHCDNMVENAWNDGGKLLFGNDGHKLSKETFKAIVTDQDEDSRIGARKAKTVAPIVKMFSATCLPAAGAAVGAFIGGPVGAVIGLGIGCVAQIVRSFIKS